MRKNSQNNTMQENPDNSRSKYSNYCSVRNIQSGQENFCLSEISERRSGKKKKTDVSRNIIPVKFKCYDSERKSVI